MWFYRLHQVQVLADCSIMKLQHHKRPSIIYTAPSNARCVWFPLCSPLQSWNETHQTHLMRNDPVPSSGDHLQGPGDRHQRELSCQNASSKKNVGSFLWPLLIDAPCTWGAEETFMQTGWNSDTTSREEAEGLPCGPLILLLLFFSPFPDYSHRKRAPQMVSYNIFICCGREVSYSERTKDSDPNAHMWFCALCCQCTATLLTKVDVSVFMLSYRYIDRTSHGLLRFLAG